MRKVETGRITAEDLNVDGMICSYSGKRYGIREVRKIEKRADVEEGCVEPSMMEGWQTDIIDGYDCSTRVGKTAYVGTEFV